MSFTWLRAVSWINRFGTLKRVERAFRSVPPATIVTRDLFGFRIALDVSRSTTQQLLLAEGERFVGERFLLRRLLREGMTIVDAGANIGYYLLLFEQAVGPKGKIIAIEPSTENLPELTRNVELNGFRNVRVHPVALGAAEGTTGLRSGINSGIADTAAAETQVPIVRLDSLVNEPVHFLKIDVEGYEGQVLQGAESLLAAQRPTLFLEVHPHLVGRYGFCAMDILKRVRRHYSKVTLFEQPERRNLLSKAAIRYLGRDPVVPMIDDEECLRRVDSGSGERTFWALCER